MDVRLQRLDLVVVGGASAHYRPALAEYEQRLRRDVELVVHELKGVPTSRGDAVVLREEAAAIAAVLDRLEQKAKGPRPLVVACDARGESLTSEALAELVVERPHVAIVIGGALGLDRSIRTRAERRISFGAVTLPHQLARLVATEQAYRCLRIARGEPYHNG